MAPPAIYLDMVASNLKPEFQVSSQNVYKEEKGAFTGESSVPMLLDMGVKWTLIGHSERRDIFGETDDLLGAKVSLHVQQPFLSPVRCS